MSRSARTVGRAVRLALPVVLCAITGALAAPTPATRPCSDPCFQAAKGEFIECRSSARDTFRDAFSACIERDRTCVNACRSLRHDCRDAIGTEGRLLACDAQTDADKVECESRFPIASRLRELCIDRASVRGFRCRREVLRESRRARRACRQEFSGCVDACGPGGPVEGIGACKAEARDSLVAALAVCARTFQTTARGCLNRDISCVQDCAEARQACAAPTRATLAAALTACRMQEAAALAACQAANPDGGPALEDCITEARADALACREAAVEAAEPGFAVCVEGYVQCVLGCPPA